MKNSNLWNHNHFNYNILFCIMNFNNINIKNGANNYKICLKHTQLKKISKIGLMYINKRIK